MNTTTSRLQALAGTPSSHVAVEEHREFITYEQRLNQNSRWALSEGSVFFEGQGAVQQAMRRICKRLDDLGVPYAIVGGMALFQHGFRRFTEDGENENVAKPGSPFVVAVES